MHLLPLKPDALFNIFWSHGCITRYQPRVCGCSCLLQICFQQGFLGVQLLIFNPCSFIGSSRCIRCKSPSFVGLFVDHAQFQRKYHTFLCTFSCASSLYATLNHLARCTSTAVPLSSSCLLLLAASTFVEFPLFFEMAAERNAQRQHTTSERLIPPYTYQRDQAPTHQRLPKRRTEPRPGVAAPVVRPLPKRRPCLPQTPGPLCPTFHLSPTQPRPVDTVRSSPVLRTWPLCPGELCVSAAPLTVAAVVRGAPTEVTALLSVMSTANCAPWWIERPAATTSISLSSVAGTCTFMSRNLTLRVTVAPASRHTRANVLSVGTARLFNLPDCGQAARCLPKISFWPPHSHLASVRISGSRNLSNTSVRNCNGCTWNSGPVGETVENRSGTWA